MVIRLIAFALIFEALFAALYVVESLPQLGMYDGVATALILARGLLGAVQFAGGWLIATHRPPGRVIAQWGLAGGAVVTVLGVGFDLAPTSVYHWWRWQATGLYLLYAAGGIVFLRRCVIR